MIIASDLEGTLTSGETWKGIGKYLAQHGRAGAYRRFFLARVPGFSLSKIGLMSKQRFRNNWIADLPRLLRGYSAEQWQHLAEWVVEHELWPKRREDVLIEINRHLADGHSLVLASGTYQPVLDAFARRLDAAAALGTPLEMRGGQATGRLAGVINNATAKAERLIAYLGGGHLDIAYGDSSADVPMLELSKTPVAVYPDKELLREASGRGWRIMGVLGY